MTHSRPAIRALLAGGGLAPRRDLGQNFVADPNTVRRIAELARVGKGDHVVEIGAGLGSLTLALAETGADVVAVEVDCQMVPILRSVLVDAGVCHRVQVFEGDARTLNWDDLLNPTLTEGWVLVANLPYNLGSHLVCDLLDRVPQIQRFLVMMQREVAERFAAQPGKSAYGAISVKVSFWGQAQMIGHVPASVFVPRPNVESSLVEIKRRIPPNIKPSALFSLVQTAFNQRRKMLRRSLGLIVDSAAFAAAEVAPTARPEDLSVEDWVRLAEAVRR